MEEIVRLQEEEDYKIGFDSIAQVKYNPPQRISFTGLSKSCCVGIIDAVDSTKIGAMLPNEKMCEYYRVFLNWMTIIAQDFDAVIVKNIGDSLLYYFPKTEDGQNKNDLRKVLECGLTMLESHPIINKLLCRYGLPPVHYRISSDYGKITIAKSSNSDLDDIFGSTVNVCSKMNKIALPNHMVIGGDLHQVIRSFKEYDFEMITSYSLGLKLEYPIYSILRSKKFTS
jgi:class 3 adenylate cyclase